MLSQAGALAAATAALSGAVWIWPAVSTVAVARLHRLATPATPATLATPAAGRPVGAVRDRRPRALLFAGLAGAAVVATFPSAWGGLAGTATAWLSYVVLGWSGSAEGSDHRLRSVARALRSRAGLLDRRAGSDAHLLFAIDLLAVCLRAGLPTTAALRSVAGTTLARIGSDRGAAISGEPSSVSVVLNRVAAAAELGSEPAAAWEDWIGHPTYGPLARALIVTGESGSAVAARLELVSKRLRTTAGQTAVARAQRVGVALMAPLGLCFLPAFVCLGVVPVVVGIAGRVFG